jgi:hypothetical protein
MKFFISKNKKFLRSIKETFMPREEFISGGKGRFLALFDATPSAQNEYVEKTTPWMTVFLKLSIAGMTVLGIAGGVSVYADTTNVSATSPLYSLKRMSENIHLAVTPPPQKAQLQATFAVRRGNEIEALQAQNPSSTLIVGLTTELDDSMSSSLNSNIEVMSSSQGSLNIYCQTFTNSTSGVFFIHLENNLVLHPNLLAKFNYQCGSAKEGNGNTVDHTKNSTDSFDGSAHGSDNWNLHTTSTTVTKSPVDENRDGQEVQKKEDSQANLPIPVPPSVTVPQ